MYKMTVKTTTRAPNIFVLFEGVISIFVFTGNSTGLESGLTNVIIVSTRIMIPKQRAILFRNDQAATV